MLEAPRWFKTLNKAATSHCSCQSSALNVKKTKQNKTKSQKKLRGHLQNVSMWALNVLPFQYHASTGKKWDECLKWLLTTETLKWVTYWGVLVFVGFIQCCFCGHVSLQWAIHLMLVTAPNQTEWATDCLSCIMRKHSYTEPNRQILHWAHSSLVVTNVGIHMDLYQVGPVECVFLMACLISLIRQWVRHCGCDYWPACQPCWPLLWRPLKHLSLLVPETLTASFISLPPSDCLQCHTPAIIAQLNQGCFPSYMLFKLNWKWKCFLNKTSLK